MPRRVSRDAALLTPSLLAETALRHAELTAVIERSRDLVWWARRRRSSAAFKLQPIRGGVGAVGVADAADLITSAITGASLCAACITKKTGVPLTQVERVVARIASALRVATAGALCDACLIAKKVFRLA